MRHHNYRPRLEALESRTTPSAGYDPSVWLPSLGINSLHATGKGALIVNVEAYHQDQLASDLSVYNARYGISAPAPRIIEADGFVPTSAKGTGWDQECPFDVELEETIAPGAQTVVVEASDSSFGALTHAIEVAAQLKPTAIVCSFGGSIDIAGWLFDSKWISPHTTIFASSGDSGAQVNFPAEDPNVIALGGVSWTPTGSNPGAVTVWPGSGGGVSHNNVPSHAQQAFTHSGNRDIPDYAYPADPHTGYHVYLAGHWYSAGGTSACGPVAAGVMARVAAIRAVHHLAPLSTAQTAAAVYRAPTTDFLDVTTGTNGNKVGKGYDLATGRGLPNAAWYDYLTHFRPQKGDVAPASPFVHSKVAHSNAVAPSDWHAVAGPIVAPLGGHAAPPIEVRPL